MYILTTIYSILMQILNICHEVTSKGSNRCFMSICRTLSPHLAVFIIFYNCIFSVIYKAMFKTHIYKASVTRGLKRRSHEGLRPCCDLCKTSHVVKSQVDLIRARDRSK